MHADACVHACMRVRACVRTRMRACTCTYACARVHSCACARALAVHAHVCASVAPPSWAVVGTVTLSGWNPLRCRVGPTALGRPDREGCGPEFAFARTHVTGRALRFRDGAAGESESPPGRRDDGKARAEIFTFSERGNKIFTFSERREQRMDPRLGGRRCSLRCSTGTTTATSSSTRASAASPPSASTGAAHDILSLCLCLCARTQTAQ